tara:strand:+ start:1065 stop:1343 length:279 start_codon:yes stop_codon:yes gene_type:complete
MTWSDFTITCKGKSVSGWVDTEQMTFDVPYSLGIKVGDVFEANNVKYKAVSVTNVGDRNENLLIQGELDGQSSKGGTANKTGESESKSKSND